MRAALLIAPHTFVVQDHPHPEPLGDEVLVRVTHAGVCGSDVHFYETGRIGEVVLTRPFIMGHEFSGVIEIPADSSPLAAGTRVAVDPAVPCGRCSFCREGRFNSCPDIRFTGFPPYPGAFSEYVAIPAENVFPLPDAVPDTAGPLLETLSVALHGVDLVPEVKGRTCAVLGAGPVGYLTALVLLHRGADLILITEPVPERRAIVEANLCSHVFDPAQADAIREHLRIHADHGPEFVFEAAGMPDSFQMAFDLARPGGRVAIFGIYPAGTHPIDFTNARRKELEVIFVRRSLPANYPVAIQLVASGGINLNPLMTHLFPLDKIAQAFDLVARKRDGVMKATLAI